jgi:tetratricopeptide (TPR) repeat protein
MHGMDYMVYAYLQLGQDKEALDVIAEMKRTVGYNRPPGDFAIAASTARYAVERGDWKAAAELDVTPSRFSYPTAISHFARGLGAARSGNPEAARAEMAKLAEISGKLKDAKDAYWAEQVDIQRQVVNAWLLKAEGKADEALEAMRAAADAEDRTEKAPITPGPLAPARELQASMLLELGKPQDALAAFELTMKKEPNRLNGFVGAATAAEQLGDKEKAKAYYRQLVTMIGEAKSERPDVVRAVRYLSN